MLFALLLLTFSVCAQAIECNSSQSCPESAPCCSQYGVCGTGSYCLGGCDPKFSYSIDACMPMPVCKDTTTVFDKYVSKMVSGYEYLGNASAADWIYEGYVMDYEDENAMIMAMPLNASTVVSSTRYVWFGKIGVRMKTSHDPGVVTAFIMFSSVQDEIDTEFIGANLTTVQTNYYFEGVVNYTDSHAHNISTTDTFENYHDYEIDWQEDYITWSVDGVVGRTLYRNQTYNSTTKVYDFPQTPSRVQLSLWPGGNSNQAPGTIAWAGGAIDWNSTDMENYGYYYAVIQSINVTCYDPPSGTIKNGTTSYQYTDDKDFTKDKIIIGDAGTILALYNNTGLDPDAGKVSSSSSKSSSTSSSSTSSSGESKTSSSHTLKSIGGSTSSDSESSTTSSSETQTGFVQNIKSTSSGTASVQGTTTSSGGAPGGVYVPDKFASFAGTLMTLVGSVMAFVL
ncbi:LAFE_0B11034g1_1 [Lachancea fermentati]|uniref:Crh-like protein n=1 Tax=Lachancea fermentati TaxID=4955 RepID=A0A1G4M8Y7_LACFM|nr:LAFE_0B11034g1_1 [Lachancea fermentati]